MTARILNVLTLGFILSLDNFRTSVLLGPIRMRWARMIAVAVSFGFWDGAAPLLGLLIGHYVGEAIGPISDYVGPIALFLFGAYLLFQAWRTWEENADEEFEHMWTVFGLPLPLSVDNIVAGTSLGMLGFSPFLSATIFGVITMVMSFVGLLLGRVAFRLLRNRINLRYEVVTGIALVLEAVILFFFAGGGD